MFNRGLGVRSSVLSLVRVGPRLRPGPAGAAFALGGFNFYCVPMFVTCTKPRPGCSSPVPQPAQDVPTRPPGSLRMRASTRSPRMACTSTGSTGASRTTLARSCASASSTRTARRSMRTSTRDACRPTTRAASTHIERMPVRRPRRARLMIASSRSPRHHDRVEEPTLNTLACFTLHVRRAERAQAIGPPRSVGDRQWFEMKRLCGGISLVYPKNT